MLPHTAIVTRARCQALAVAAVVAFASAATASAQAVRYTIDDAAFQEQLSAPAWDFIARQPCARIPWNGTHSAAASIRRDILDRIGIIPPAAPVFSIQSRKPIYQDAQFTVELVQATGRLPNVPILGYLAQPTNAPPNSPTAIVLQGANSVPEQAFGWVPTGAGDFGLVNPPFAGIANALIARSFAVFVPFIDDDYEFAPILPWIELDNFGFTYRSEINTGGTLSLVVPQIMAAVDFMRALYPASTGGVAMLGWEEGAFLAGITAAVDPRVGAVVKFMPPRDSRAMRATVAGTRVNAPFSQYDCVVGDVQQAALIAPRPLLYAYADDDATLFRSARFVTRAVSDSVAAQYGGRSTFEIRHLAKGGSALTNSVAQWLGTRMAPSFPPVAGSVSLLQPDALVYPEAKIALIKRALILFVGNLGVCREIPANVSVLDSVAFRQSADLLRDRVRNELRMRPPSPTRQAGIILRQTLRDGPEYKLEWLYIKGDGESGDFGGLLATPVGRPVRVGAVLSFDGNYGVSQVFGLPPQGNTPYLGAYGDILARSGYVVFAPFRPTFIARGAPAIFRARGASMTRLQFTVGLYSRALDVLLAEPSVDSNNVIAYGISEAAYAALYTTAFDQRLTGLVFSNPLVSNNAYFSDPTTARAGVWQTEMCTTADDVMKYLIAPRPFTWEGDNTDLAHFNEPPLSFPREILRIYQQIGVPRNFNFRRHLSGHETHIREIWDILPFGRRSSY